MGIYKITNITNLAGKRDFKYNSDLEFDVIDNMVNKSIKIKPGDTIFLTVQSLPLSIHNLRVKNLITVTEVSEMEATKSIIAVKPKKVEKEVEIKEEEKSSNKKSTTPSKKKIGRDGSEVNVEMIESE